MSERCPVCAGSGTNPDAPGDDDLTPCPACGGSGELPDEQMMTGM